MRLLHTSDWHIGRSFHGQGLLADQARVLQEIARIVHAEQIDAVLVAGDVYDRGVPSAEAVQVATRALRDVRQAGAVIVASSGNHDSAPRLGAFAHFLAAGGLHLATSIDRLADPVVLSDAHGEVAVYAIPYLEPQIARPAFGLDGPAGHQQVLDAAMQRIRADLAGRPAGTRSVVLAHAFVVGARPGGSERSIAVGGVESVTADIFAGIDYVALGHLHRPQVVSDRVRYCGSPLPYAFSEAGQRKGVWIVDLDARGGIDAEFRQLPLARPLATVRGTLDEILCGHIDLVDHYLSVELTDEVRPVDAMRRLRERFPHALTLSWQPPDGPRPAPRPVAEGASDQEIICAFLADCRGGEADDEERALVDKAVGAVRTAEVTT